MNRGLVAAGACAALLLLLAALTAPDASEPAGAGEDSAGASPRAGDAALATFAGGCFWCMEPPFDALDGVLSTTSGYTGGSVERPSYEQVARGGTGHAEAVQVRFDPTKIRYEELLDVFWRNVDPLDAGGQFCDRGASYRTGIFVHDEAQRRAAEASKAALAGRFDAPIVTPIEPAGAFYPAEAYHQDYYRKNPIRYRFYRRGCGRDARLEALWGEAAAAH